MKGVIPALPRVPWTPIFIAVGLALVALYVSIQPARLGDDQIINRVFLEGRLRQHLRIAAESFAIAVAIGVPLGILIGQGNRRLSAPVFAIANLGQAIPGVALLALTFTFFGLGLTPTVIALVFYALLPILRNTSVGIRGVDASAIEAAKGMGMTRLQTLRRIQLPLAAPAIFGGLRTALVLIIGTATLANFIGGGGLGDVISAGIGAGRERIVLTGAAMVAALALLADWLLATCERLLSPRV
jgi:osmoprotectant transport system permease protein